MGQKQTPFSLLEIFSHVLQAQIEDSSLCHPFPPILPRETSLGSAGSISNLRPKYLHF